MQWYNLILKKVFLSIRISRIGYRIPKDSFDAWLHQKQYRPWQFDHGVIAHSKNSLFIDSGMEANIIFTTV